MSDLEACRATILSQDKASLNYQKKISDCENKIKAQKNEAVKME